MATAICKSSGDLRFLMGKEGVKVHTRTGLKFRRCCKRSLLRSCIGSCARLMVASSDELDAHCGGAHVKSCRQGVPRACSCCCRCHGTTGSLSV